MDVERYQRAREIFEDVVELPAARRHAVVQRACGEDTTLLGLVTELLLFDTKDNAIDRVQLVALCAPPARRRRRRLEPGMTVERYVILRLLGEGGAAQVWAVEHSVLETRHALKVLLWAAPSLQRRMLREARAQAQLTHPNIVPVHDVLDVEGTPGLLMPLIAGPSLDVLLDEHRPAHAEAVAIMRAVADGVRYVHDQGLVHRDLKPGNVLLDLQAGAVVPRVADFGLVKGNHLGTQTLTGAVMGTPAYAAPEQLQDTAAADHRADLWAMGVMLYELLTGRRPFRGRDLAVIIESQHTELDYSDVPPALEGLVRSLLRPDPGERLQSCDALLAALPPADALGPGTPIARAASALRLYGEGAPSRPIEVEIEPDTRRTATRTLVSRLGAVAVAVAALFAISLSGIGRAPPPEGAVMIAPVPLPVPEATPEAVPARAPAPEPIRQPATKPAAHAAVPVAGPAPPARSPATVRVSGEGASGAHVLSGGGAQLPLGSVPAGDYTLRVVLPTRGLIATAFSVSPGESITFQCDDAFGMCSPLR